MLYRSTSEVWLAPMFVVVTTSIYKYTQYPGGTELEDRTLALKLFASKRHTKAYPTTEELVDFGHRVCGVSQPGAVLVQIADAMSKTMGEAKGDSRIPPSLLAQMAKVWDEGCAYAN